MALRIINLPTRVGKLDATLDPVTGALAGTHVGPPTRTGVLSAQTDAVTAALLGSFTPSANRSGLIVANTGDVTAAIAGTFRATTNRTGVLSSTLADVTGVLQGSMTAPSGSTVRHGDIVPLTGANFGASMPTMMFAGGLGGELESTAVGANPNFGNNRQDGHGTPGTFNWDRFSQTGVIRNDATRGKVIGLTNVSEAAHEALFPAPVGFGALIYFRYLARYLTSVGSGTPDPQVKFSRLCCGSSNVSDTPNGFIYQHYNTANNGNLAEQGTPNPNDHTVDQSNPNHETWYFGSNPNLEKLDGVWRVSERVVITNSSQGAYDGYYYTRCISANSAPGFQDNASAPISPPQPDGDAGNHRLQGQFRSYMTTDRYVSVIWQHFSGNGMNPLDFSIDDHFVMICPDPTKAIIVEFWYSLTPDSRGLSEIQLPVAWSDNSLSVKFNKGGIPSGTTGFLVAHHVLSNTLLGSRQITVA